MSFIRINSTDHTDMFINLHRIMLVEETKTGCKIHFDRDKYIQTTASYETVVKAIERSSIENEN